MNYLIVFLITFGISIKSFADRYGVYDSDSVSSSTSFFDIILGIVFSIGSIIFIVSSFLEWKERRKKGLKPEPKDDLTDLVFTLVGYAVVAIFLVIPILFIIKLFGSHLFIKENWYWMYLICFSLITYLRRT